MPKTAAQALLEYETRPGLRGAYGPVSREMFTAGFLAGWEVRDRDLSADLAEAREGFAAMTGEASRLEAAMEVLEIESALRIAHLEERVLQLQLYQASRRQRQLDERAYVREIRRTWGIADDEDLLTAARRMVGGVAAGSDSGLRVFTRDRRARELTVAEIENRDPVAHCTMCPECGAPLGDHTPVVLYRVRPEDPLWEVRLRCPPAVPRRTVRDVLGALDAETDVWAAERVVAERDKARRLADDTTEQLVEWRRAAARMLGHDPNGTLDSDAEMRTALRAYVDGGDDVRRMLETISRLLHDFEGVSVVDCVRAAADEARRSRRVAESSFEPSQVLVVSAVATALIRQGVTLPEQSALGDLVAGVRTLGERAQRTIPGKPAARGAGGATAAEAQLATLFADLIDALGLDQDMAHTPAALVATVRDRAQTTDRWHADLAAALELDAECPMDTLIATAREIRMRRDRLTVVLTEFRARVGGALRLPVDDQTGDTMIAAIMEHVEAREAAAAALDAISRRIPGFDGGSVVEAVHNLSLLAQKRGEALAEALDAWAAKAGWTITDGQRARISELRSFQVRPAAVGEAG